MFPLWFPNKENLMALIGVIHCPACGAIVNANWQSCLACSSSLESAKSKPMSFQAQGLQERADLKPKALSSVQAVQPGMTVQYRIPVIKSPTNYEWEWHRGKIELVDERRQMVLVIPEREQEPWLWVAMIYIKTGEND